MLKQQGFYGRLPSKPLSLQGIYRAVQAENLTTVFKLLKKEFPDIGPSGELIIVDVLEGRCRSLCDGSLTFALSDAPGED
jgi:hypothetical protein